MVEASPPLENKIRWPLLHLADVLANSGEGLVSCFLARSGVSLEAQDLVGELFCPSVFSGDSTGVGVFSVENPGRYAYHFLEESGVWFTCNCLGGLSLSVDLSFSVLRWPTVLVASDPKLTGDVVADGHFLLLERSRSYGMSMCSSSNLQCGGGPSRDCSGRRQRRRQKDPCLGCIVIFLFSKGAFAKVAM